MKKKGIALSALLGTIVGIIILIALVILTFKIFNIIEPEDVCINRPYWDDLKKNLKQLDKKGQPFSTFFPNAEYDCQIASFVPGRNSQINAPPEVNAKGKAAICLCEEIPSTNCEGLQDCYFFDSITDFRIDYNYPSEITEIFFFFNIVEDSLQLNTHSRYHQKSKIKTRIRTLTSILSLPNPIPQILGVPNNILNFLNKYIHETKPTYLFLDFNKNNNVLNIRSSLQ